MTTKRRGRRAVFRGKMTTAQVHGILTPVGHDAFETAREQLRGLYRRILRTYPPNITDGDTIEALARGWPATRAYLEAERDGVQS